MNAKELRELEAWIAENVFEWSDCSNESGIPPMESGYHAIKNYTTNPAASDAMDDAILQHPQGNHRIELVNGVYYFTSTVNPNIGCEHPDKKICRALFAKKLFEKGGE
jgi:hypothetical protein